MLQFSRAGGVPDEFSYRGAAAFLAVQVGGYGAIDDTALNAQDIGGPENAPAFSISRADAAPLRELLMKNGEARAAFDAKSTVKRDCVSWNIVGELPGFIFEGNRGGPGRIPGGN